MSAGVLRPVPGTVPEIDTDVRAARTFERTGAALGRSVAGSAVARPDLRLVPSPDDDLSAELRGSLLLIAAVLLPALMAVLLLI